MSSVQMRKLELVLLKRDLDLVLERLGEAACFQVAEPRRETARSSEATVEGSAEEATGEGASVGEGARPGQAPSRELPVSPWAASLERVLEIKRILGLSFPEAVPPGTRLPGEREEALLLGLAERVVDIDVEEKINAERAAKTREVLEEARAFAGLSLPFKELDHLSFLAVRVGRVDPVELPRLAEALGERAILFPVDERGTLVAATSRKGRFALDTELARSGFSPRQFAPDFKGVPPELPETLERELAALDAERVLIERRKTALRAELEAPWRALAASFAVASSIEEVKSGIEQSELACRLEGWVPRDRVRTLAEDLDRATRGRVALRTWSPRELDSVRSGEEDVPVLLKRRFFVSSFERLVVSYGVPLYGSVDPTPFVAFFFVLLFSIMFGDVGQGGLILAAALALRLGLIPSLERWKPFAPIGIAVGFGSMAMGFLTGSFFTSEEFLVPATEALTEAITGHPIGHILTILPTGGAAKIFAFFGFTVAVGAVINSIGLVINIVNKLRSGKRGEAFFSKTGLAGALFFWWAAGIGVRSVLGGGPAWWDGLGLGIPLAALVFEDSLSGLVDGKPHGEAAGAFAAAVKGFVAVMESISYFLSNTLSFLRVGAFALSHGVLSYIVFLLGDLLRERAPAGILWQALVLVIGNAVILLLEGMIVAIQVVRLQYYEFLSKFLTETGKPFSPFRFRFLKE